MHIKVTWFTSEAVGLVQHAPVPSGSRYVFTASLPDTRLDAVGLANVLRPAEAVASQRTSVPVIEGVASVHEEWLLHGSPTQPTAECRVWRKSDLSDFPRDFRDTRLSENWHGQGARTEPRNQCRPIGRRCFGKRMEVYGMKCIWHRRCSGVGGSSMCYSREV